MASGTPEKTNQVTDYKDQLEAAKKAKTSAKSANSRAEKKMKKNNDPAKDKALQEAAAETQAEYARCQKAYDALLRETSPEDPPSINVMDIDQDAQSIVDDSPSGDAFLVTGVFRLLQDMADPERPTPSAEAFDDALKAARLSPDEVAAVHKTKDAILSTVDLLSESKALCKDFKSKYNTTLGENTVHLNTIANLEVQLQAANERPVASPVRVVQTEKALQLKGVAGFVRNFLGDFSCSWFDPTHVRTIQVPGKDTTIKVSPVEAAISLMQGVATDLIGVTLETFMAGSPHMKEQADKIEKRQKAKWYTTMLGDPEYAQIAVGPLLAVVKSVREADPNVPVTAKTVADTLRVGLGFQDGRVRSLSSTADNAKERFFPNVTNLRLIEKELLGHGEPCIEGVVEAAKAFIDNSWDLRTDENVLINLAASAKENRDAAKGEKEAAKEEKKAKKRKVTQATQASDAGADAGAGAGADAELRASSVLANLGSHS